MFKKYDKVEEVNPEPRVLTLDEKKAITDAFALGKDVLTIRKELVLPVLLIQKSILAKQEIENKVIFLMKGEAVKSVSAGGSITYYQANTKTAFDESMAELHPNCEALSYITDTIISNATDEGNWSTFKAINFN